MHATTNPNEMKKVLWWIDLIPVACKIFDEGELVLAYSRYDSSEYVRRKWYLSLRVGNKEVARGKFLYRLAESALENADLPEAFRAKCSALYLIAAEKMELRHMSMLKVCGLAALIDLRDIPGEYTEHRYWSQMRRAIDTQVYRNWGVDLKTTHVKNMLRFIDMMSRVFDEGEIVMYAPNQDQWQDPWLFWGFVHEGREIVRASAPVTLIRHLLEEPSTPDAVRAKCQAYLLLVTGKPSHDL